MDDFTWGNTRLVIGEGGNKKVIMNDDEKFDESMIPLKKFSGKCRYLPSALVIYFPVSQSTRQKHGRLALVIRTKLTRQRSANLARDCHHHHGQNRHGIITKPHNRAITTAIRTSPSTTVPTRIYG
jgi:hypothetical protein